MEAIGYIESPFPNKFSVPRQSGIVKEIYSKIVLFPKFQASDSLQGLESFSHIWIQWLFHENNYSQFKAKISPPRLEGKKIGVFATRSPHRPNSIGLSLVKIHKIESDGLWVTGADLIDKTPILDIKPYLPQWESIPDAKADWPENVKSSINSVNYSSEFHKQLIYNFSSSKAYEVYKEAEEFLKALISICEEDPRPRQHREHNTEIKKEDFVFDFYDFEIFFRVKEKELLLYQLKLKKL